MAYEKTNWVDNETPINAANLNKMEDGIVEASKTGGVLDGTIVEWEEDEIPEGYEEVEKDIINSTEITDKENKTYSAKIIDEKNKITMINATDLLTLASGYTFKDGNVFKDRNRYFGNFTIQKTNGTFATSESQLGSWKKNIQGYYNIGCFLCTAQWNISAVGRAYISKDDGFKVYDDSGSNKYSFVKIAFDFIATD